MSKGRVGQMTLTEVAAFLGVSTNTVRYWKKREALVPTVKRAGGRRNEYYDPVEVAAFKEAWEGQHGSKDQQLRVAQSYALARMTKRRLDALEAMLGLSSCQLSVDPENIRSLYKEALHDSKRIIADGPKLGYWADKFYGVNDVYLELVAEAMGTKTPWAPFLELARQLQLHCNVEAAAVDIELKMAYWKLLSSCKSMNSSIFAYCVRTLGLRRAVAQFPHDFGDDHFDVMMLATEGK